VASFTRQIPAGGEGKITVKVFTEGYGGRLLKKGIQVMTNDPENRRLNLKISGKVTPFADIQPKRVRFSGTPDEKMTEQVVIRQREDLPFRIVKSYARRGRDIRFELRELEQEGQTEYRIDIENLKKTTGRYVETITLVTDSKIKPKIHIKVYGRITKKKSENSDDHKGVFWHQSRLF
jgi:hypothetical protein